jgi:hypothetical protein
LFNGDLCNKDWLKVADGPKILSGVFHELSEGKLEFVKTKHTPAMLNEVPEDGLSSLVEELRARLVAVGAI